MKIPASALTLATTSGAPRLVNYFAPIIVVVLPPSVPSFDPSATHLAPALKFCVEQMQVVIFFAKFEKRLLRILNILLTSILIVSVQYTNRKVCHESEQ